MAASKDGRFLYRLLEGPLWDAEKKDWEKADGKEVLRILEFDVAERQMDRPALEVSRSRPTATPSATST